MLFILDYLYKFNWHILPVMNPDGYTFTRSENRYWSKNRAKNADSDCIGVNLNRNFASHWQFGPDNPCHISYKGPFPVSEPEVQAVTHYVNSELVNR